MKRLNQMAVMLAACFAMTGTGHAMGIEVFKSDKADMTIGGRAQLIGYAENVGDPIRDNNRLYLFLKQARLNLNGHVLDYKYNTEWAFAAEDINGSNTSLTLLDFAFDIPVPKVESTWIKVGQFKVPYSRERLAYSGNLQFAERSLITLGFNPSRDVGAALHTQQGMWAGAFGVFTGGGRDTPQRFLPEILGFPLVALRAGYNDGIDKDIFTTGQNDLAIEKTQKAVHVNGFFMKDTLIGHNSVTNLKTAEKSLLTNSNWNPFIVKSTQAARGNYFQVGMDAAYRTPISTSLSWSNEAEVDMGQFHNRFGTVILSGVRAQTALLFNKKVEVALRYSGLLPDDAFANATGTKLTGKTIISEIVPAITYYIKGHDLKVVLDAPVLLNVPVAIEKAPNKLGSYVLTEQPDQTSYATQELQKQTVTQARLMIQVAF